MRTIKFRGQRVYNKEWVYGSLIVSKIGECEILVYREDVLYNMTKYSVIPSTIGQYTGLTDKNGVEIYEGDILRTWYSRDMSGMDVVVMENPVEFEIQSERSGFDIPFLHTAEIIGNIHNK